MARDFLAIPMSAACSNPTLNADIMKIDLVSMAPEILEALMCAMDWLQMPEKKKILKQSNLDILVCAWRSWIYHRRIHSEMLAYSYETNNVATRKFILC
ncbi:hypothetical protein Ddye_031159 [Dipteronia dyeriana]|uniref:Uncharacterized protein n=1 Tax=Dipteronia dyeriana TaxID=168575 RepID=A0AAD9THV3_9ROSI|nr:hypothetical protein Ddye_031159 [Dipteronia dyeriana]